MKKLYTITVKGKTQKWAFDTEIDPKFIDELIKDGLQVEEIINSGPMWVMELGLIPIWCFFQDIYNFKNPFKK